MSNHLRGRRILITGATGGIGLATARRCLQAGARVAVTGRDPARLASALVHLAPIAPPGDVMGMAHDACGPAGWEPLLELVRERFCGIDVLVNNHGGGGRIASLEQQDDADIARVLDTNLASVIRACRAALPLLRAATGGHVVNVGSACTFHAWPEWSIYTAAKAGLAGFTRCLHLEMVRWGGKASLFCPGATRTGFQAAAGQVPLDAQLPDGDDMAEQLVRLIDVPPHVVIEDCSVWGTAQVLEPY